MSIFILSGPPAAGKNTVAAVFARHQERCAVIDVDMVRWIVVQPHKAPWEGEEGRQQQRIGIQNTCLMARNLIGHNFLVVILDVVSDETAQLYRQELSASEPRIVLLLPSLEEVRRRNAERPPRLTEEEILALYRGQASLKQFDRKIDNTALAPEAVAAQLVGL